MYTLYHGPGTCSLAIKAALALSGAPHNIKPLDLAGGEHLGEAYRQISPLAKVPALSAEGGELNGVLTEGSAILLYLASCYPEAKLLPEAGSAAYADALKWLQFLYATVHPHWGRVFFAERYGRDEGSIRSAAASELSNLYDIIEGQLSEHRYIAGDELTAADLYLMVTLYWQGALDTPLTNTRPNLARYLAGIFDAPVIGEIYRSEFGA